MKLKIPFLFFALMLMSSLSLALEYKSYAVEKILKGNVDPTGVVFEILSWDSDAWSWAAPMLKQYRGQLLEKYPEMDIALVSHGAEQFDLVTSVVDKKSESFKTLKSLSDQGVDLHVCGTHSGWRNVDDTAYLDFIDVSPSGPAQINDYIKLGYTHILLRSPL